jgi:MYXO-CTERM domain-containing protein
MQNAMKVLVILCFMVWGAPSHPKQACQEDVECPDGSDCVKGLCSEPDSAGGCVDDGDCGDQVCHGGECLEPCDAGACEDGHTCVDAKACVPDDELGEHGGATTDDGGDGGGGCTAAGQNPAAGGAGLVLLALVGGIFIVRRRRG